MDTAPGTNMLYRGEVFGWWSEQRGYVVGQCSEAKERYVTEANAAIDQLSLKQLLYPSKARRRIERQIISNVNVFNRRMERSLKDSCAASIARLEGWETFGGPGVGDATLLITGGAAAASSVGLAGVATGLATTVTATSILGLFVTGTFTTFSWPVFTAVGSAAALGALLSPQLVGKAKQRVRERYKNHIRKTVSARLTDISTDGKGDSTKEVFLLALDSARDTRLMAITEP